MPKIISISDEEITMLQNVLEQVSCGKKDAEENLSLVLTVEKEDFDALISFAKKIYQR